MLKDIQNAIKNLEARINAEETQIKLMKKDLKVLKEKLLQETEITRTKSLPESLDKLFEQFFIQDDTHGLGTRASNVLRRAGISIEDLYNISFVDLSSVRNASGHVVAVIIAVLEHYGIEIEIPDLSNLPKTPKTQYSSRISKQVNELLPVYREKIIFK